ncbi:MAG: CPBP family intramembrane glutamic endopeptidase [Actinomycetes bacterium]
MGDGDRYPQLLRTPRHRWWRSLLGLLVASGFVVGGAVLVVLAISLAASGLGGSDPFAEGAPGPETPLGLLETNLAIAVILPSVALAVLLVHRERPGWLSSVAARLRWRVLLRLLPVALLVVALFFGLSLLVPPAGLGSVQPPSASTLLALLAVILLTTPLQAAAEEYGFRGYLTQVLGSWFSRPVAGALVAAAVSAALFALAHGASDPWLFSDRVAFGLVASWVAWRTGGLEAAVALHIANNLVALVYGAATGTLADAFAMTAVDWPYVVLDVAMLVVFAVLVARLAGRWSLQVRRAATAFGQPAGPGVLSGPTGVGYSVQRPEAPGDNRE